MAKEIIIKCTDEYPLSATLHESPSPKGIIIIASAIGIKQSYYERFAEFLSQSNYNAITFDYRGTGKSCINNRTLLDISFFWSFLFLQLRPLSLNRVVQVY